MLRFTSRYHMDRGGSRQKGGISGQWHEAEKHRSSAIIVEYRGRMDQRCLSWKTRGTQKRSESEGEEHSLHMLKKKANYIKIK